MKDGFSPNDILCSEFPEAPRNHGHLKLPHKDVVKRNSTTFSIPLIIRDDAVFYRCAWRAAVADVVELSSCDNISDMENRQTHRQTPRDGA